MTRLTYLGHSAFHLESGEHSVLIDPFLSGNPSASAKAEDFSPETILLTHAHNDHVGDTVEIAKRSNSAVICNFEFATWLGKQGVNAQGGNHGGTFAFPGGTAKFVPAWHTSSYQDGDQIIHVGVPSGFIVRFDGTTIYFAGDTCLFGDMKLIGEEGIDIAVLPIGDHFTMGPADALRAVRFIEPKLVIPCHYDTFPPIQQDPDAFKQQVESQTNAQCLPLKPGEAHEF